MVIMDLNPGVFHGTTWVINHNFLTGKPSINGQFPMAMLNNQRVFHEAKVWTFTWQEVRRWKTRQFRQHEIT